MGKKERNEEKRIKAEMAARDQQAQDEMKRIKQCLRDHFMQNGIPEDIDKLKPEFFEQVKEAVGATHRWFDDAESLRGVALVIINEIRNEAKEMEQLNKPAGEECLEPEGVFRIPFYNEETDQECIFEVDADKMGTESAEIFMKILDKKEAEKEEAEKEKAESEKEDI